MASGKKGLLIVGVGNIERGDDGAGPSVCRRLKSLCGARTQLVEHSGEATSLLSLIGGFDQVIIVDACVTGAPTGDIQTWNGLKAPALSKPEFSTHGLGVAEAIELGRALDCLPPRLTLYTIEGAQFDQGAAMSVQVEAAVEELSQRLMHIVTRDSKSDSITTKPT